MINYFKSSTVSANVLWILREKIAKNSGILNRFYKWQYRRMLERANAYIPLSAQFADKPCFPHSIFGVFISQGAIIGSGCTIFHQVTIGSNTLKDSQICGSPTIGDNVYIGCGAKIIGGISIGNNVRIGANCVVTENIPDNATVVMQKPRIIVHDVQRDNRFSAWEN